jgi:DNA-binding response OmpR family regulator/Tfp pilus assembly protein PilZ
MEPDQRPALLVGRFERPVAESVTAAMLGARVKVENVPSAADAKSWLSEKDPLVVVVDVGASFAEDVCFSVRANPKLSLVPILGLTPEISDLSFAELFGWGADDLVRTDRPESMERRLRLFHRDAVLQPASLRGIVVVADGDHKRRVLLARVLRNAGFDARFVLATEELADEAVRPDVSLIVADVDLQPGGAISVLQTLQRQGKLTPWVLACPPKKIGATAARVEGLSQVIVYDAYAPIENVLFFANEVLRGRFLENRSTPRLLFGATIAFRLAGRDRDEVGYTYNISGGGMYVRTMAPLSAGDEAWLELQPPRTDRRVRLEGKVIWRRVFGSGSGATVPPGFGLSISGGSERDMERFRVGYEAFAKDMAARFSSPPAVGP